MSSRCCFVLAVTLAALPALIAPAAAAAGTASTRTIKFDRSFDPGTKTVIGLRYQAGRQERNRLRIEVDPRGATLTDRARIRAGRGCRRVAGSGRRKVRCSFRGLDGVVPAGDRDEVRVRARLGARRDVAVVSGDFPGSPAGGTVSYVTLEGGPGPDRLQSNADFGFFVGGNGDDRMTGGAGVDIFGEGRRRSGSDTISGGSNPLFSYGDRAGYRERGRRVVADLAGDRDDGERGERDRIGADVESLFGGRGSDRITGNAATNLLQGGSGRRDVVEGGAGPDLIRMGARKGVVLSRDGENDTIGCDSVSTRALADGYDEIFACVVDRNEPVGLQVDIASSKGLFKIDGRAINVAFGVYCPPGAGPASCGGQARLLGADGRALGEIAFDFSREDMDSLSLPVSEQDRQRIRAAGSERARLVLDLPGVPQRRYALTLTAP